MQPGRHLFSVPEGVHYLNHAYMSPVSRRVAAAGEVGIRRLTRPWEIDPDDFFRDGNTIRALFARLIHAPDPGRVALIPATSYGLSQVARNTPLDPGRNVVMVEEDFPSNHYVWRRRCERTGAVLRRVPAPDGGDRRAAAWTAAVLEAIDEDTAVVTLSSLHWTDGTVFDLERIGERAREVGAAYVVDGTQSVGALPFDLGRVNPDALICAAYKWLTGPYSIGVAWLGERYAEGIPIEETWITREGSDHFAGLVNYTDRYRSGSLRYDVGETANFVLVPMLVAALEQVLEWDPARVQSHGHELTRDLIAELQERGFLVSDESSRSGHLFGLRMPEGTDAAALRARLRERNIHVSVRGSAVRISCHLYNDEDDVQALRDALVSLA